MMNAYLYVSRTSVVFTMDTNNALSSESLVLSNPLSQEEPNQARHVQ